MIRRFASASMRASAPGYLSSRGRPIERCHWLLYGSSSDWPHCSDHFFSVLYGDKSPQDHSVESSRFESRFGPITDLVASRILRPLTSSSDFISDLVKEIVNDQLERRVFKDRLILKPGLQHTVSQVMVSPSLSAVVQKVSVSTFVHDVDHNPAQREYAYRSRRGHQHYVSARLSAKPFTV